MPSILDEINSYLNTRQDLKEGSKKTYINTYKNLREVFNFKNDKRRRIGAIKTQKQIIDTIKAQTKYNKLDLLKVVLLLKKWKNKPIKNLEKYRMELFGSKQEESKNKLKKDLNLTLDYQELINIMNEAFNKKDYITYMLLYILINLNVRNTDLLIIKSKNKSNFKESLRIVNEIEKDKVNEVKDKQKKDIKLRQYKADDVNFMYLDKDKDNNEFIDYVRNNYKTKTKYGVKDNEIKDNNFITAFKTLDLNKFIFKNKFDASINRDEFNQYINRRIKPYLTNKDIIINQTLIYKIVQKHNQCLDSYQKCQDSAFNRGHDLNTQLKYYTDTKK